MIKDVTDLEVYRVSLELLKEVYLLIKLIPEAEKDLIWQIKRASRSIPAILNDRIRI